MSRVFTCGSPHLATDLAEKGILPVRVTPNPYHPEGDWSLWEYAIDQHLLDALEEMYRNGYYLTNSAKRLIENCQKERA